jgi:hypothetical protein
MKFFVICAAGVLALSVTACAKSEAPTTTGGGTATTMAPATMAAAPTAMGGKMAMAKTVSVTMNAQNGSGESGTATLTAKGANTLVVISLKGEPAEAKQPAHIHPGSCAKLNPIPKYPLTDVYDGKSTTTVTQTLSDLDTGHFAINVHASAANLKKYVSCGDIPVAAGHM